MPRAEKQLINNSRHFRLLNIYFSVKQKLLSIGIHIIVILLIITRGYIVHPFLVLEIPLHGLLDSLLKLERWLPTQFLLQFSRVDGVTHIMTLSVGYISDEIHILAFLSAEQSIHGLDNHLDDIDVLPLVETADVVSLGNLALVENHIDGTGMIHYIQPVAHVLTLTIYRQWLAMTDVVDEQRNQLLWELVWTIVVGAVGYDGRHTVCIVESTHEMV